MSEHWSRNKGLAILPLDVLEADKPKCRQRAAEMLTAPHQESGLNTDIRENFPSLDAAFPSTYWPGYSTEARPKAAI